MAHNIQDLVNNLNQHKTKEEVLTMELNKRDSDTTNKDGVYTETPITSQEDEDNRKDAILGYSLGDFIKYEELTEVGEYFRIVYLHNYTLQVNRFDEHKQDIIMDLIDREGFEFKAYWYGALDIGNRKDITEALKIIKDNAFVLKFNLVIKGDRKFINPTEIIRNTMLEDNQDQVIKFFRSEINNTDKYIEIVSINIGKYPNSSKIWYKNALTLNVCNIPNIMNRQGEYVRYFSTLLNTVENLEIRDRDKEIILIMDIIDAMKLNVQSLENMYLKCEDKEIENIVKQEALYNIHESENNYYLRSIHQSLKQGIQNSMIAIENITYGTSYYYSNSTKEYLSLERGE